MSKLVTSSEMNNWTGVRNNRGETIILIKFRYAVSRLERLLFKLSSTYAESSAGRDFSRQGPAMGSLNVFKHLETSTFIYISPVINDRMKIPHVRVRSVVGACCTMVSMKTYYSACSTSRIFLPPNEITRFKFKVREPHLRSHVSFPPTGYPLLVTCPYAATHSVNVSQISGRVWFASVNLHL